MIKLNLTGEQLETIEAALETYCIVLGEQNDPYLAMAADAQKAIVKVLDSKHRCTVPNLPELQIKTSSFMPEHIELEYVTNGFQGGDAGHGGYTTLTIRAPSTCATVSVNGSKQIEIDGGKTIDITVRGDWESGGFACAFIKLGKKLFKKTRVTD
jgi:hypothetical protein